MPVILDEADWPAWLGEESATPARLLSLLKPYEGQLKIWPVDRRVGNVRNKGAELALPI
jgi:putative SOS response-associated peptidase YedK